MSNKMCDLSHYVDFDPLAECGIKERVRFDVLQELLGQYSGEELKDQIRLHKDDLVPKHIIIDDILTSINYMNGLARGISVKDDIDHLGNRRLRCVGELLQNQFRIGFSRMERVIRERMTIQDLDVVTPQSLINIRPVTAAIKEFFGSSPLSQFMDQTNPLAELTHKRRLSALGPGGLSRERANMEVRDVHYSHYGRMCPIETPEGPNIGLISYLATYARINEYGFIEAPYRAVDKETGNVSDEITYMTADEEDNYIVGQAAEPLDENGCLINARITARHRDEIVEVDRERVDYIDVSPRMMVSIATAMIPFLPNDDANRALMGANMQRQAVPLLRPHAPIVGTGMEHKICIDSEIAVLAEGDGVVTSVDARHITVKYDSGEVKDYKLTKFLRSNHGTCINQRPIVEVGERVHGWGTDENGQTEDPTVLADGPATEQGEIALGQQHPGWLHDLGGLQLRGRRAAERASGAGGPVYLHPHRGVRDRRPGHQAGPRGDHPGHPQRGRGRPEGPGRERHHPHRRRGPVPATSWWARSRPRARPTSPPRSGCCGPSSVRRPGRSGTPL